MMLIVLFASAAFLFVSQGASIVSTPKIPITDHLQGIFSVIPTDLIRNISYQHLKTDEGFKSAVKFMQSEEWVNRVKIIREKPEWIALKKHMKGFGINIDKFIKCAEGFLENVTVKLDPKHPTSKKSVKSFLIDVEQNLPTIKIVGAIHEKMMKDSELQQMFEKIASNDTHTMVDNVLALSEIRAMLKDLADIDVNLTDLLSLMYTFLGWGQLKLQ